MTGYVWAGTGASICAHTCVCIHKHALCKMGQGCGREKGPHLISSSKPPLLTSMPLQIGFYITEAVRYEQLIFLSLFFAFYFFYSPHAPSLSYCCASFFLSISYSDCLGISVFPCSFLLPLPDLGTVIIVLFLLWVSEFLVHFVHGWVVPAVDVRSGRLPLSLNPAVYVMKRIALKYKQWHEDKKHKHSTPSTYLWCWMLIQFRSVCTCSFSFSAYVLSSIWLQHCSQYILHHMRRHLRGTVNITDITTVWVFMNFSHF